MNFKQTVLKKLMLHLTSYSAHNKVADTRNKNSSFNLKQGSCDKLHKTMNDYMK